MTEEEKALDAKMNSYTTKALLHAVHATEELDETGDAQFTRYLKEEPPPEGWSFNHVMQAYLQWANGDSWEQMVVD